jgi:chromosome partitioning protein
MGIRISFANHKGGSGKTTSAVNISALLAEKWKKVLLVDIDPQSNVTLAESPSFGQPISIFAPQSNGARDYRVVAERILNENERGKQKE